MQTHTANERSVKKAVVFTATQRKDKKFISDLKEKVRKLKEHLRSQAVN